MPGSSLPLWALVLLVGVIATLIGDLWQQGLGVATRKQTADWGLVGRWFLAMCKGRFRHERPDALPAFAGDVALGWLVHYVVGIAYSALYFVSLLLVGVQPGLGSALLFALLTLAAPFLWMKPSMGLGWCGSRLPKPLFGQFVTVSTHLSFGVGMYLGWLAVG